jgi:hypothetical protein
VAEHVLTRPRDPSEARFEESLRPRTLAEYIGQEKVKANLGVFITAARSRSESLDHVLLLAINPAGEHQHQQLPWLQERFHIFLRICSENQQHPASPIMGQASHSPSRAPSPNGYFV